MAPSNNPAKGSTKASEVTYNIDVEDISDDTIICDYRYDSPISLIKGVAHRHASPNVLKNKPEHLGRFVYHAFSKKNGNLSGLPNLWNTKVAAMSRLPAESMSEKKYFVCIVWVPTYHLGIPFPEKDSKTFLNQVEYLATNGGMFYSLTYLLAGGKIPKYGDWVRVNWSDPETKRDGLFLYPEVKGAGAGSGIPGGQGPGSGGGGGGSFDSGPGKGPFKCFKKKAKTPKPKQSKNTKTTQKTKTKETKPVSKTPKKPTKKEVSNQTPAKKTLPTHPCPDALRAPTKLGQAKRLAGGNCGPKGSGVGCLVPCFQGNCAKYRQMAGHDPVCRGGPGDFSAEGCRGLKLNRLPQGRIASSCQNPIMGRFSRRRSKPRFIIFHTGAYPTINKTICTLAKKGLSTHYEIARDGTIYEYFDAGIYHTAHAGKWNKLSIGVDLNQPTASRKGGARFVQTPTSAQIRASRILVAYLCNKYKIPNVGVPTIQKSTPTKKRLMFRDVNHLLSSGVGVVGHLNLSGNRADPGSLFIMEKVAKKVIYKI